MSTCVDDGYSIGLCLFNALFCAKHRAAELFTRSRCSLFTVQSKPARCLR